MSRRLTLKQRLFVKEFTSTQSVGFGNATKAAELAGYQGFPGSTQLSVQGHHNLRNPKVQREIERVLEASGVTAEKKAQVLFDALVAETRRAFCADGEIFYSDPEPDHAARLRALELAGRMTGDFLPQRAIERRELLQIQQNILIVPSSPLHPIEKDRKGIRVVDE